MSLPQNKYVRYWSDGRDTYCWLQWTGNEIELSLLDTYLESLPEFVPDKFETMGRYRGSCLDMKQMITEHQAETLQKHGEIHYMQAGHFRLPRKTKDIIDWDKFNPTENNKSYFHIRSFFSPNNNK